MEKYNNLLVAAGFLLVTGLQASNQPFFDKPTKNVIKKAAQFYAGSSLALYGVGKTLQKISGAPFLPKETAIIDFDAIYNDTFPKDYSPKSFVQKKAAQGARNCLVAGSVYSAPLRSVASVAVAAAMSPYAGIVAKQRVNAELDSLESLHPEKARISRGYINASIAKATVKETIQSMARGSRYGIIGFGLPVACHKYLQNRRA